MEKNMVIIMNARNDVHAKMAKLAYDKLDDGQIIAAQETLLDLIELLEMR